MWKFVSVYSGTLVALGALAATACLACSWYINRLQADLATAVRKDAAGMEAAADLQVQLRNLRVHSLVLASDGADPRRETVRSDLGHVDTALRAIRQTASTPENVRLGDKIDKDYAAYRASLRLEGLPLAGPINELAKWSDAHHMGDLIDTCRALSDGQRGRMHENLERSETQTTWAGRVLFGLGVGGVLAGLMSGYVAARALNRRVAKLFFRVQAVQAHLDQDVGAMTVQDASDLAGLDKQLGEIVQRVNTVCARLNEQERELHRAEHLAAVGNLAAGVAHEIRNPLTGVKLLLQGAVRPQNQTELTPDRLHLALQEISRIERTVQGLMDFAGAPPLKRVPQDLNALVKEAVKVAQGRAELKSVAIRFDFAAGPLQVSVDHDRILSLLTNLLFNAIDATPAGGEVLVSTKSGADGMIQASVADSGAGFNESVAKNLFAPFTTSKPTGTGLGLTVSRRIAQEHGGTLTAAQRPEGGACLILTLPAAGQK